MVKFDTDPDEKLRICAEKLAFISISIDSVVRPETAYMESAVYGLTKIINEIRDTLNEVSERILYGSENGLDE